METIKNYLDSMFRGLPKTEKVMRAKSELLQMMEDKYTELINNGISENEAVGTVISEFGNLDELAGELGISEELTVKKSVSENSRKVSFEEVKDFITWRKKGSIYRGIGIALCICCVVPPIIFSSYRFDFLDNVLGPVFMFIMIALGVCLIVFSGRGSQEWNFLRHEPCSIDDRTYSYISEQKQDFIKQYSIMTSIAIACYILCCVPAIVFDYFNSDFFDNLGGASLFILVATGVFLNVYASSVRSTYNFILGLNNSVNNFDAFGAANAFNAKNINNLCHAGNRDNDVSYIRNPKIRALMSVYWLTVTCIYLCWSFMTFDWHITWIIWPIAGVVDTLIRAFSKKDGE